MKPFQPDSPDAMNNLEQRERNNVKTNIPYYNGLLASLAASFLLAASSTTSWAAHTGHMIDGATGTAFTLTATNGYISTADGNSVYFWGFALGAGAVQYPGTTLIVNQGETITVTLYNRLPVPVSLVFPGQKVTAAGGSAGLLTQEAPPAAGVIPGGPVTYTFTATQPGTFLYQSGTRPDLQIEMGLVGALIVRPTGFDPSPGADPTNRTAYGHADSHFDLEYLFLLTEMDERIHDQVEVQVRNNLPINVDTAKWWPVYWFINGRTGPDTLFPPLVSWLPSQPYDCMPIFHPGEKVLMRLIGAGRDPHPFHHHGNHAQIIARDGRLLTSGEPGAGADLAQEVFTISTTPGGTIDAIFSWTGKGLGWDAYGHQSDVDNPPAGWSSGGAKSAQDVDWNGNGIYEATPPAPFEDPADHGKPFPVILPTDQELMFGQMYSGSPFIGAPAALPPGQGGFNPSGGFIYMWHSHAEKEIVNNNLFPGGMLTLVLIEAYHPGDVP